MQPTVPLPSAEETTQAAAEGGPPPVTSQPTVPLPVPPSPEGGRAPGEQVVPAVTPVKQGAKRFAFVAFVLALAIVAGFAGGYIAQRQQPQVTIPISTDPEASGNQQDRPVGSVARTAADVVPSVVSIKTRSTRGSGSGSGLIIRSEGYILTNNHVISDAGRSGEIITIFEDGSSEKAELVGRSVSYDLAVLKINRSGLKALEFGDSDQVVVGDPVIAIGAPLGLQGTVTTGIVSALNRPVKAGEGEERAFINAIQTDAAINPGNSGGPLVDMSGRVVGINSAIAHIPGVGRDSSGSIGLGFAIPSKQAVRAANQIINTGKATYPIIGVLLDPTYTGEGVRITDRVIQGQQPIVPGSPADLAGIKKGDLVTHYQGRPIDNNNELIVAIRAQEVGDQVQLTVRSDGQERTVTVTLNDSRVDE